jgi:putative transposase
MPRKAKPRAPRAPLAPVPADVLDQFVGQGPLTPEELDAVVRRFKKAVLERALGGELTHHLGYAPGAGKPEETTNHRNGRSGKTVLTDDGPLPIDVPRDREGTFEPRLIGKHERRFTGFDDKILALDARGLTVREIQAFLAELYAVDVSPDLISTVTDAVVTEVTAWQARPLEPMYPVVFFDALRVKIRDEAVVRSKAGYLALAVLPDGTRDILGIWIEQTEGAKFWMKVFTDLKTRGCLDILIAVTDGLKGMSEARRRLSRHDAADVPRPSDSSQLGFCQLERAETARPGLAPDRHRRQRRRRARGARGVCRGALGPALAHGRRLVATRLDARDSVFCLSAGPAPCDLHHQRAGERARAGPQDHQDAWTLSDRRRGDQADLVGAAQHHRPVALPTRHWKAAMGQFAVLYEERFIIPRA